MAVPKRRTSKTRKRSRRTRKERITSRLAPLMLWYTDFAMRHGIGQQPKSTRRVWRHKSARHHAVARQLEAKNPLAEGPT